MQADDPDSVIKERIGTQVGDDSNAFKLAFRTKHQGVEVKTPWVRGIKITSNPGADGIYAAENEIRVTVLFSRAVEVEGSLELSMQVGTEVKQVLYQSGLGTEELVFTYQVVEGDEDSDGVSIEAGSLVHGEEVISGLSGNAALRDHEGLEADPRHRVDGIRPLLVSDKVELDGDQLILPFAEMLDRTSIPKTDDFRVTVSGKSREVSVVVVKVREVILTLISPAEVGESIAVSYDVETQSAGPVLRDQAGNPAEGFINQMVTNQTGVALPARAVRQIQTILEAKQKRTPAQRKVDSQLVEEWQKLQGQLGADRMVTVDLRAEVTSEVLERIRELGGTVLNSVEKYRSIRAEMPLSEVEALAAHEAVRFIRAADEAATRNRRRKLSPDRLIDVLETAFPRALNTTQGDVAHQVNTARITHSVDGTGIGIGVLSDGVGTLATRQATGDLPSRVTVLPGQHGVGDEGTAMLEIVHDLAPGAELYFATAFSGMASFAENIEALCEAGADVIVDDVFYFAEAPFQNDIIAQGATAAVEDGCFFFSAAGNGGNKNDGTAGVWEGDFTAGNPLVLDGVTVGVQHDFGNGVTQNRITEDSPGGYVLWWGDPLEGSANDYDLFLLDENGNVLRSSTRIQDGTQDPFEIISDWDDDHTNARLVVVKSSGAADRFLRLDTLQGKLEVSTAGNVFGHSAAEKAISVAAVPVQSAGGTGGSFNGTESVSTFSSDGPRRIFFEPDGTPITAGNFSSTGGKLLQKPDLTAATCVWTSTPGFSSFCGTSSSAPHAAAIGALVLEAAGGPANLTQATLLAGMKGAALDIETTGVDRDSGAGILMAPGAVDAVDVDVEDRNQAPTVESALSNQTFVLDETVVTLDLADTFGDPDNDTLTYVVLSSDSARISLSRIGSMLTVTPEGPGTVEITVRATDPDGLSAVDSFSVSVSVGSQDYDHDKDDLIEISTLAQLDAVRYDANGDGVVDDFSDWPFYFAAFTQAALGMGCSSQCMGYELTEDLDFDTNDSSEPNDGDIYWNDGNGWAPIGGGAYQAIFEGNGHTIANLFIDRSNENDVGLFRELGQFGVIRNLGLIAMDLTGKDYVGGLVGDGGEGRVGQSYVTGSVSGKDVVGGLAGRLDRVWSSYAAVRVLATGDGVGGLVGAANVIEVSYATGRVTGRGIHPAEDTNCESVGGVGGLVGNVCDTVAASYATGVVVGVEAVGGLAGTGSARFRSSFWDVETSGMRVGFGADDANDNGLVDPSELPVLGVTAQTTSDLQVPTDYGGIFQHWRWDLDGDGKGEDPWHFGTVSEYPALLVDTDDSGVASWPELGYQLRSGPGLSVSSTSGMAQVSLSWTAVEANHWSPAPGLTYTLYRDDGTSLEAIGTGLTTRSHTDSDVKVDDTYIYQVAAVVVGGEVTRSRLAVVVAGASNQPPVAVGLLADLTLRMGAGTETVTVSGAFEDLESDILTYGAVSSATGVVATSVSGDEVIITPLAVGRTTVTVTATDTFGSNTAMTQLFTVTVWSTTAVDYDSDDNGLIEISNLAQLDAVRYDPDGDGNPTADGKTAYETAFSDAVEWMGCYNLEGCSGYELADDLDFDTNGNGMVDSGDTYWNNGTGWMPIGGAGSMSWGSNSFFALNPFRAIFDGNGHTISHLFINTDTALFTGLFGFASLSTIQNVGLVDVAVNVESSGLVGGLVAFNEGKIRNSYVTGRVSGKENVGALVGINYFNGDVRSCYSTIWVTGEDDVGGLVADNRGVILASYATGKVSGFTEVGGLVGNNQFGGEIQASYTTGPVSGVSNFGGLVGSNEGVVTDSYWDTHWDVPILGQTIEDPARTAAQLQHPTDYSGIYQNWNLDLDGDGTSDSPWHFGTSNEYPVLSVDVDGTGVASWQEFGYQIREGPILTATYETAAVILTWTAVTNTHWTLEPAVTYTLYREKGTDITTIAENLAGLSYSDDGVVMGETYTYQVAAVVADGEAVRSNRILRIVEEDEPEDPADFTGADLKDRRLTLRFMGEEGATKTLVLQFGEGDHFGQTELGVDFRSGYFNYEKTGSGTGTVRLEYDDGGFCEVLLVFTNSGVGVFNFDCSDENPDEGSFRLTTGSLFVPVILSSAGLNQSFFTSELTLTNRGNQDVELNYTYTANLGEGTGTASDVLPSGRQRVESDALNYLRGLGVPISETGGRIGTLRVGVELGSEVKAMVRTTTVVPEGRAGLAYLGVTEEIGFDEPVYLCGLRQNSWNRSNVAFQNMGALEEEAITLRTTVYSGEAMDASARLLDDVTLAPGEFHQYSGLLGSLENGYVRVERVEGEAPFYAYGVINDQTNSDGSFVFPITASSLEGRMGQTLPVIVETSVFQSELKVTNFSQEPRTLDFWFVAEEINADDNTASFSMRLEAGEQEIIPDLVNELRSWGVAGLGSTRGYYSGALFVEAKDGDMSGIVIGARTGSQGGGGRYSVFYNAVPFGKAFSQEAWVEGLQQNEENRSNLALINTGEVDGSASVFHLEIYDGETGMLAETVVTEPIPARGWRQINGILLRSSPDTRQGYIRIEKVSGDNPFLAYGVVNDGGAPGERSGDGAYVPARE